MYRLIIASLSVSVSLFLMQSYLRNKTDSPPELPVKAENAILNRYAIEATKIRLFSQQLSSYIGWDKDVKYAGELSLKISIENRNVALKDYFNGINLLSPFDLSLYKDSGILKFYIKGGVNYSHIIDLDLILKDKFETQSKIHIFKFIDLRSEWQHFSVPLAEFSKESGCYWNGTAWLPRTLDWGHIESITFLISPAKDCDMIEIFIDDFSIRDNSRKNLDLFSYYE
ncbi:MAG TPA: hypothetical protein DCE80_01305 [Ignavibacteriales bacterium]|nr:hypothetical protein [Ignavibacteriales bacterium]